MMGGQQSSDRLDDRPVSLYTIFLMVRLLDVVAVLIVAVVLLLPQPTISAFPAVEGDQADLDRLAQLEDALQRNPGDPQAAVELARAYLQVDQPAWALIALGPHRDRGVPEVHQVAAFAYATLLLPAEALREAEAGLSACERTSCPDPSRIRLGYLAELMRRLVRAGLDPRRDPLAAKRAVAEALHAAHPVPPAGSTSSRAPAP